MTAGSRGRNCKMAASFDGTGVITRTSNDFCVVSLTIDGTTRSFLFSKTIFFTFGILCEGSMTNLLEEGLEVELCYRISHPGGKPCIVAVWLGDKPEIKAEDNTTLSALYDMNGRILGPVNPDNFMAKDVQDNAILISKDVVFRDGLPIKGNLENEEIIFDAVPAEIGHPLGASYEATCAWIGAKPKMVDRFGLRFLDNAGFSGEDIVEGTVTVIANDVVALADVAHESMLIKVLLFRGSFGLRCERIQDVVDVGDNLCLRLGYGYIFSGSRQWYAITAFKISDEVGDMNVLEDPVDNTGKLAKCGTNDSIPENPRLFVDTNLKVLYKPSGLSGVLLQLVDYNKACIVYENLKILVHRKNFYIDKKPCSLEDFVRFAAPGNNTVRFDAISSISCESMDEFFYEATCAWMGSSKKKPVVSDVAASLPPPKMSLLNEKGQIFYGTVTNLLLPKIAFVVIPGECATVVVHTDNFIYPHKKADSERILITDYVKLKDYVEFKVERHLHLPNALQACDVQPALFSKENWDIIKQGGSVSRRPCKIMLENKPIEDPIPQTKVSTASLKSPDLTSAASASSASSVSLVPSASSVPKMTSEPPSSSSVWGIMPVKKLRLSQNRGFLLNCEGKLRVETVEKSVVTRVEHVFGTSQVRGCVSFSDILSNSKEMLKYDNQAVRFDAQFVMCAQTNADFRVLRMWQSDSVRPKSEHLLVSELATNSDLLSSDIWDRYKSEHLLVSELAKTEKGTSGCPFGKIKSIPFHDCAIAIVENVPVVVNLGSLQTDEEIDLNTASIEAYLTVGDGIIARYEKRSFEGKSYYRAVKCYAFLEPRPGLRLQTNLTRKPSTRDHFWRFGEIYRKEPIVRKPDGYFVEFVSSKDPTEVVSLNLFGKGKVFIHGNVATPEMLESHVGCEITFHASHLHTEKFPVNGMRVVCAWIGPEPPPQLILEEIVAVPKGLVCPTWRYDAIVESFPLPFHALCHINYVPLVVRILNDNRKEVLSDLKIGDEILLSAEEKAIGDAVMVYSNNLLFLKRTSEIWVNGVFRNLTGCVVALPEPVGKIQIVGADLEVSFELCHVRKFTGSVNRKQWLASVKDKITIGKQVYVSAKRRVSKKVSSYRAIEVYFMEYR